jgi:meso-butanediol dehydrogenase / (S,S)-butanediol dehydrogenase / diacetyl reductase
MESAERVVLVSGVASGIGRAAAARFVAAGWQVVGIDQVDADGVTLRGDVADEATWRAAAKLLRTANQGRLDALVNCAGTNVRGSVEEASRSAWERILAVNLTSVFLSARECLPLLKRARGSIVNVASGAGLVGVRRGAAYAASKGGVIALTRQMAVDYASDGVRVNVVCPGVVDTPLVRRLAQDTDGPASDTDTPASSTDGELRRMADQQLMGRLGTADEIASTIVFLASADASFMTGAVVAVDGGYTAR